MKILVVGGGGREHAIIKKLKENKAVDIIYARVRQKDVRTVGSDGATMSMI